MTKREKFENIVEDSLLKNFDWYVVPNILSIRQMQGGLSTAMLSSLLLKRKTVESAE